MLDEQFLLDVELVELMTISVKNRNETIAHADVHLGEFYEAITQQNGALLTIPLKPDGELRLRVSLRLLQRLFGAPLDEVHLESSVWIMISF